ncbi:MAG: CobW family GTP-binding protein [Bacillota bacterium]|nr:CobW family GTP-binding protein [Bacillota bacterium]
MKKTAIILLTGFLGSGKTSVLNHLLETMPEALDRPNIGVIVNEFGKVSIDAPVLSHHGYQIAELNNGSIFCQCLAGTFVESMAHMLTYEPDYLLIESSGLADPAGMSDLLIHLKQKTDRPYTYAGTICVIDAKYFRKLSQSLDTINRQILAASLIVVNKADLVDPETLLAVENSVRRLNPLASVVTTMRGKIDPAHLQQLRRSRLGRHLPSLNTQANRPATILMLTDECLVHEKLLTFIELFQQRVYRIKGLVRMKDSFHRLDVIGGEISLEQVALSGDRSEIVIIPQPGVSIRDEVAEAAGSVLGIRAEFG